MAEIRKLDVDERIVEYGGMVMIVNKYTGRVVERIGDHPHAPDIKNYKKTKKGWVRK